MIERGSDDPFVWYARAMEHRSLGDMESALASYTLVAKRYPAYVPTYLMAGQTAETLSRIEEARSWYERGIAAAQAENDTHARSELQSALASLSEE